MEKITNTSLKITRHFTKENQLPQDIFDEIKWTKRDICIKHQKTGEKVFEQLGCEFPEAWSDNAAQITAYKYFYGKHGTPEREYSLRQLISRVVEKIAKEGLDRGYFRQNLEELKPLPNGYLDDVTTVTSAIKSDPNSYYNIFRTELTYLLLHQYFSFNSPLYFNFGIKSKKQVASACFITGIEDNLKDILDHAIVEGLIFSAGSGNGTNLSTLRERGALIADSSGTSSGGISFDRIYDVVASTTKSGGVSRRAARLVRMDVDHGEILEFIRIKAKEEKKARILAENGYDDSPGGEASSSVFFQNANYSVGITDKFMKALKNDEDWPLISRKDGSVLRTIKAKFLWDEIAQNAWESGDPAVQFHDKINEFNICLDEEEITCSNPCAPLDSTILTNKGFRKFADIIDEKGFDVVVKNIDGSLDTSSTTYDGVFLTNKNMPVLQVEFSNGVTEKYTPNHIFYLKDGSRKKLIDLQPGEQLLSIFNKKSPIFDLVIDDVEEYEKGILCGWFFGDGSWIHQKNNIQEISFSIGINEFDYELNLLNLIQKYLDNSAKIIPEYAKSETCHRIRLHKKQVLNKAKEIGFPEYKTEMNILNKSKSYKIGFLRGLSSTDGSIRNKGLAIGIYSIHKYILEDVLRVVLEFGGYGSIHIHDKQKSYIAKDGKQRNNKTTYLLQVSGDISQSLCMPLTKFKSSKVITTKESVLGKRKLSIKKMERALNKDVYDITVPYYGHFVNGAGAIVAQCSEFLHLNFTSCNLASINNLKYLKINNNNNDQCFDLDGYVYTIKLATIAMNIVIDCADFPTDKIKEYTLRYRPIGIGFSNLGALLMSMAIPYDSIKGRNIAGILSGIITATAFKTSNQIATSIRYAPAFDNKHIQERSRVVINKHLDGLYDLSKKYIPNIFEDAYDYCSDLFQELANSTNKYANTYVSNHAPVGTIGLMMDCETLGVEPELALIKYKTLVDGGTIKYCNKSFKNGLLRLGYSPQRIQEIENNLHKNNELYLDNVDHYKTFACSFDGIKGVPVLSPQAHILMLASMQKLISGGMSKTVNLPNSATVKDIQDAYMLAYELGVKCVAVYRDGSKIAQPLSTKEVKYEEIKDIKNDVIVGETIVMKEVKVYSGSEEILAKKNSKEGNSKENCCKGQSSECECKSTKSLQRNKLPDTRQSIAHKLTINGHEGYLHVGLYEDGSPGEIFIRMAKEGSTIGGLTDAFATMVSLALQWGVPLQDIVEKLKNSRYSPAGFTNNSEIKTCTSITDYVVRFLELKFLDNKIENNYELALGNDSFEQNTLPPKVEDKDGSNNQIDWGRNYWNSSPEIKTQATILENSDTLIKKEMLTKLEDASGKICINCGQLTVLVGHCYFCSSCGNGDGCIG